MLWTRAVGYTIGQDEYDPTMGLLLSSNIRIIVSNLSPLRRRVQNEYPGGFS